MTRTGRIGRPGRLSVLAAAALLAAAVATAQEKTPTPKAEGPKPPPELDALSYFLGPWTSEGELKSGPMGEGGPTKGREICRWMPGRFFAACMMEMQSPLGMSQVQAILGWDAEKKVYRWWTFDNVGRSETASGTLKDGTWTWSSESKMGDKVFKTRYTVTDTQPESYAFTLESSPDGKKWSTVMTGKSTKITPRPMPTAGPRGGAKSPPLPPAPVPTKSP